MRVLQGIDRLMQEDFGLRGKRLGLITSPSGVSRELTSSIDVLWNHYRLTALFSPEHGVRGDVEAGGHVPTYQDPATDLPVYSLYSGDNRPQRDMLQQVDAVALDVQDIGCRYYTYISTMRNTMEECAKAGKTFVVLDRVNPIGGAVEGNLLDLNFVSFVGIAPIPQRHGMTIGELAHLFNEEYGIGCDVQVVPIHGWQRNRYYDQTDLLWVNPSPNLPGVDAALLYPGTCFLEGTNLSEGRGTTRPFEMLGAPWLQAETLAKRLNGEGHPGVLFRPVYFQPTASKHQGKLCQGVQVHITDREALKPVKIGLHILQAAWEMGSDAFEWLPPSKEGTHPFIDLLAGTDTLRKDMDIKAYWESCMAGQKQFEALREKYLLYP